MYPNHYPYASPNPSPNPNSSPSPCPNPSPNPYPSPNPSPSLILTILGFYNICTMFPKMSRSLNVPPNLVLEVETDLRNPNPKASISLACEFLATVLRILSRDFRTTFVRVSRECRENFLCRELVANWSRSFSTC